MAPFTLPADAKKTLEHEGWLVVPRFISDETLAVLLRATETLEQAGATFTRDTVVRGVGYEVQSASGRKGEPAVSPGALRKITFPSKGQKAFDDLRRDRGLIGALEQLGLSAPKCLVDQVNLKLPRLGTGFPFHQDVHFVIGKTRGRIERHGGLNLVIALDAADSGNGGFEVLGRTHHALVDFAYDAASTNEGVFDETHRTLVSMQPGDAVIFHPMLAHGSGANRSDRLRRLVTLWFRGGGPDPLKGPHIEPGRPQF
ncbi:MAG: phytanoyl-CoA dioxygenase family protein [Archangium sp.]|nr:phytanoyl-CoA dioxygenase family protein [Archangium sp.]